MISIGGLRIGDDLRLQIGTEVVQLRPDEGLRVVERMLRVSTRRMVAEEAAEAIATRARPVAKHRQIPRSC